MWPKYVTNQIFQILYYLISTLALIQVATSFEFDAYVQPICIGNEEPQVGELCVLAGWADGQTQGKHITG